MDINPSFTRWAGLAAVISAPVAVASVLLLFVPVAFNFEAYADPAHMLSLDQPAVSAVRWGLLLDLLGYYLLLAPLAILTRDLIGDRHDGWARLASWSGRSYVLIGAAGAAALAVVYPGLADAYSTASGTEQTAIEVVFAALSDLVIEGLWNTLEVLLAAVWLLTLGVALRSRHRAVSRLALAIGAATLLDTIGMFVGNETVATIGLNIYLVAAPIWALAMGLTLLRQPTNQDVSVSRTSTSMPDTWPRYPTVVAVKRRADAVSQATCSYECADGGSR